MSIAASPDLRATSYVHPRAQLAERREVLASVAKEAGLADAELRRALRGGPSLEAVARQHGLTPERLVEAIDVGLDEALRTSTLDVRA
jgi:DNA-binding phage protein